MLKWLLLFSIGVIGSFAEVAGQNPAKPKSNGKKVILGKSAIPKPESKQDNNQTKEINPEVFYVVDDKPATKEQYLESLKRKQQSSQKK